MLAKVMFLTKAKVQSLQNLLQKSTQPEENLTFLNAIEKLEVLVAKVLSVAMMVVIVAAVVNLLIYLAWELFLEPTSFPQNSLLQTFGLFLGVLIALEILENITAYLREGGT